MHRRSRVSSRRRICVAVGPGRTSAARRLIFRFSGEMSTPASQQACYFFVQAVRLDIHSVSHDATDTTSPECRKELIQHKAAALVHYRVARLACAPATRHLRYPCRGEQIRHAPLALVAPVDSNDTSYHTVPNSFATFWKPFMHYSAVRAVSVRQGACSGTAFASAASGSAAAAGARCVISGCPSPHMKARVMVTLSAVSSLGSSCA